VSIGHARRAELRYRPKKAGHDLAFDPSPTRSPSRVATSQGGHFREPQDHRWRAAPCASRQARTPQTRARVLSMYARDTSLLRTQPPATPPTCRRANARHTDGWCRGRAGGWPGTCSSMRAPPRRSTPSTTGSTSSQRCRGDVPVAGDGPRRRRAAWSPASVSSGRSARIPPADETRENGSLRADVAHWCSMGEATCPGAWRTLLATRSPTAGR